MYIFENKYGIIKNRMELIKVINTKLRIERALEFKFKDLKLIGYVKNYEEEMIFMKDDEKIIRFEIKNKKITMIDEVEIVKNIDSKVCAFKIEGKLYRYILHNRIVLNYRNDNLIIFLTKKKKGTLHTKNGEHELFLNKILSESEITFLELNSENFLEGY